MAGHRARHRSADVVVMAKGLHEGHEQLQEVDAHAARRPHDVRRVDPKAAELADRCIGQRIRLRQDRDERRGQPETCQRACDKRRVRVSLKSLVRASNAGRHCGSRATELAISNFRSATPRSITASITAGGAVGAATAARRACSDIP